MHKLFKLTTALLFLFNFLLAQKTVYVYHLNDEIGPPTWRQTQAVFKQAKEANADLLIIELNTYGGAVDAADNISTSILGSDIPVYVFINKNAASAGALISIACDSIYMAPGSSIGAATVVNQEGEPMPEKYQSYMRSKLRANAEAAGRDPNIAEGMNDARVEIEGISEEGKIISFTTKEAIKFGYCEGEVNSIDELLSRVEMKDAKIIKYEKTGIESIIDLLLSPAISGILIMIIIGGIYFELQSPGLGFPIVAAITAAILYFAPLYLEGLAANWEIVLFVVGVILVIVELFAIPGFGVFGISGIVLIILGLTLSMVGSAPNFDDLPVSLPNANDFGKAFFVVMVSIILSITISLFLASRMISNPMLRKLVLASEQRSEEGYTSANFSYKELVGQEGIAHTVLKPSGKVEINGELYEGSAIIGYIEKGEKVKVKKYEGSLLYVVKV